MAADHGIEKFLKAFEANSPLLSASLYHNPLFHWVVAILLATAIVVIMNAIRRVVAEQLQRIASRTVTEWDDFAVSLLAKTRLFFFWAIAIAIASTVLHLPVSVKNGVKLLPFMAFLLQLGLWGQLSIQFLIHRYVESRHTVQEQLSIKTMVAPISFVVLFVLWMLLLLIGLDHIGMNVSALLTGLGVGGVAVALAVQNVLGDLFAALSIVIDKPFVLGDFINVDTYLGTVEHIGLKTTRLRSLSGEQLIFSNSDLMKSRIRNYKRMYERRVVFTFNLAYQTPFETLKSISGEVKDIITRQGKTRFDRAHFLAFGESALNFEVVFYVLDADYNIYMDIQQEINYGIFERFAELGVNFAYPTRTLIMANSDLTDPSPETLSAMAPNEWQMDPRFEGFSRSRELLSAR